MSRNYKTKEKATSDHVRKVFPHLTWFTDCRVPDGCSKRRPDLIVDLGYQVIVIEIDENQHDTYDCSCENKRLMEISQDVDHRPMVFVRFNPDDYVDAANVEHPSCWKLGKDDVVRVRDEEEWNTRLDVLCNTIQYWLDNKTEKTIEVVHLFYDMVV